MRQLNIAGWITELRRFDYQQLSFDNLGSGPLLLRWLVALGVGLVIIGSGWLLLLAGHQQQLQRAALTEVQLQQQYRQLAGYRDQPAVSATELARLEARLDSVLATMPNEVDLPALIDAINQAASGAGLSIAQITPDADQPQGLFSQTPIRVVLGGGYHQLGAFIAALAALPYPISLHRLTIKRRDASELTATLAGPLIITVEARAYRQTTEAE